MNKVIITAPSLDPNENVSGVSEIVRFIIANNKDKEYLHFVIGKKDNESGDLYHRVTRLLAKFREWKHLLATEPSATIHYSFPLDARGVLRDYFFIHYAAKHQRKMIVHVHGGLYLTKTNRPWFINKMIYKTFKHDVPFVVLSEIERQKIIGEFHAKHIEVLPNCVDLTDASSYVRTFKKKTEPLNIGYLGRIVEEKGMDWLIQACGRLSQMGIDFRLMLAGNVLEGDKYLQRFSDLLGEKFQYKGIISGAAKAQFLRDLDVFVLPSYFEGLPLSLIETMAYGAVPVTTPVGSIPEVVKDGTDGLIIKEKDATSIVDAIIRLNTKRDLLENLSKAARQTIFTKFSPQAYINKLNTIYP